MRALEVLLRCGLFEVGLLVGLTLGGCAYQSTSDDRPTWESCPNDEFTDPHRVWPVCLVEVPAPPASQIKTAGRAELLIDEAKRDRP